MLIWFFIDREKHLKKNVDKYGSLRNKYSEIDNYLVTSAQFSIAQHKRDILVYVKTLHAVHFDCILIETFGGFELTWKQRSPFGDKSKTWKYPDNSYQQKALKDIENYMIELTE